MVECDLMVFNHPVICYISIQYHPVTKHGVLENALFIGGFPNETSISRGFSIAIFDYQRVNMFAPGFYHLISSIEIH